MVSKIGVLVPDLTHSQLTFDLLNSIDEFVDKDTGVDVTIFYENLLPMNRLPKTGIMNIYELWGYSGIIISTTIINTYKLLKMHGNIQPYFYMYDFEWIYNHNNYPLYYEIAKNNIPVIARTEEHAKIIYNNFNIKPIFTLEQFNMEELWQKLATTKS